MPEQLITLIRQTIQENGPINTKQIQSILATYYHLNIDKETINSLLYGPLHEQLIRDRDSNGYPVWRIKDFTFEAAKGLEVFLHKELVKRKIITSQNTSLDYQIHNHKNGKTYHLDLAIFLEDQRYNIEIDGFEHIRADARASIQHQLNKNPQTAILEIDWMDNKTSYVDFKQIDNKKVFKWLNTHQNWCIRYHEELLKPHDLTRNIWLIENGWKIIRFWNFEVKDNLSNTLQQITQWLNK